MKKTTVDEIVKEAVFAKQTVIICNQCAKILSRSPFDKHSIMYGVPPHDCEKKAWWRRLLKHLSGL